MAKAHTGHPDGDQFKEALAACDVAASRGAALFPISDSIYIEISKIGQHRQRRDLREIIERISGFMVVTSRSVIATHEIESLLDRLVGPSQDPINEMSYVDWGVARAFGMVGGFRIKRKDDDADVTDEVRAQHPAGPEAFDRALGEAQLGLNRSVLDGPTPEEEPSMRALGWDPSGSFDVANRRALQEIEQVGRFDDDPAWRRGRIRDVVAAREVIIEVNETLSKGLSDRRATLELVFSDPEETRRSLDSMPSFDVAVSMKTEYHRNPVHRWKPNDIHDIDALASTLPYCDIVVTDKAVAANAVRAGLAERLQTIVLARLSDLIPHL